jgi:hypothetical protein
MPRRRCFPAPSSSWSSNSAQPDFIQIRRSDVTDTYWYLTGTPELLGAAGERLEKPWEALNAGSL